MQNFLSSWPLKAVICLALFGVGIWRFAEIDFSQGAQIPFKTVLQAAVAFVAAVALGYNVATDIRKMKAGNKQDKEPAPVD